MSLISHKLAVKQIHLPFHRRGLCPAGRLLKHLLRPCGLQGLALGVEGLAVCRDAGVAVNHAAIMQRTYATKKPNRTSLCL
jgi:hypothetical protein